MSCSENRGLELREKETGRLLWVDWSLIGNTGLYILGEDDSLEYRGTRESIQDGMIQASNNKKVS